MTVTIVVSRQYPASSQTVTPRTGGPSSTLKRSGEPIEGECRVNRLCIALSALVIALSQSLPAQSAITPELFRELIEFGILKVSVA